MIFLQTVNIAQQAGDLLGVGGGQGGSIASTGLSMIIILLVLFLAVVLGAGIIIYYYFKKQYKYTINIFEEINGSFYPSRKDKARVKRIGVLGDEILYLQKSKKIVPMPQYQTGVNTFWFFIRGDGEWVNFKLKNLDEASKEAGAVFLDKEMRYARTQLSQINKDKFQKASFLEKYGGIIAYTLLILVTSIGFFLLIDKLVEVAGTINNAINSIPPILEELNRVLGSLDTIKTGGSGLAAAV